MHTWFHCNKCYLQLNSAGGVKFILTSCGHIYCDKCFPSGNQSKCYICRSECSTILLNSNLSPDIQVYFVEPEDSFQKAIKVLEFQKNQGKKLFEHLSKEHKILQNKYLHAKEYIKKLSKQHENLQKDHLRLRNLLKSTIKPPGGADTSRGTPTGQGSFMSTPGTITPTSGNNPNRFIVRGQQNGWNLNRTNSSIQDPSPFRTPSIYQQNPSMSSAGPRGLPRPSPSPINFRGLVFDSPAGNRRPTGIK